MLTHFKSALNQVKAEDTLINKTEIYLRNELSKNKKRKINKFVRWSLVSMPKKLAMAACLAVLFIGGGTGSYAYYQTPTSYLSLDINPSIELGVNSFGKVVKAEGYNKDGKAILSRANMTGSNLTTAVNSLISSAVDNGFIAKDGSTVISLTSETDNTNIAVKLQVAAETGAIEALKEKGKSAVIYKENVSLSLREESMALGVTPGKLNLINKLKSVEPNVTVDQYKDVNVKDIIQKIEEGSNEVNTNTQDNGAVNSNGESTNAVDANTQNNDAVNSNGESTNAVDENTQNNDAVDSDDENTNAVDENTQNNDAVDSDDENTNEVDKNTQNNDTVNSDDESSNEANENTQNNENTAQDGNTVIDNGITYGNGQSAVSDSVDNPDNNSYVNNQEKN